MKDNNFLCEGNSISQSCKISDEGSVNSFHENAKEKIFFCEGKSFIGFKDL